MSTPTQIETQLAAESQIETPHNEPETAQDESELPQNEPEIVAPLPVVIRKKTGKMTNKERAMIVQFLLQNSGKDGPRNGMKNAAAIKFTCTRHTVYNIWNKAKVQMEANEIIDVRMGYYGKTGPKRTEIDLSRLKEIPLHQRTSIRALSAVLDLSTTTCHRLIKRGEIRSHSNATKPYLTDANTRKRLEFCLSKLQPDHLYQNPTFEDFYNHIHIDEKWFFMTKTSQKYYLLKEELDPHRASKSRNFIAKIMFLAAVARPRYGDGGEVIFDGKIGIFPFTFLDPAKRNSKNKPRGTVETKPIASITKQVIKDCLINKLLPAIKQKWPQGDCCKIWVQQDNARPHIAGTDHDWVQAAQDEGLNIQLYNQPPNSPDMNVLDLGFFNAIQSLQYKARPENMVDLVNIVIGAYEQLDAFTLNKVWLNLQYCMDEVIKAKGTNAYKIPHARKNAMHRQGLLPTVMCPNYEDVNAAREHLTMGIVNVRQFLPDNLQDINVETQETQYYSDNGSEEEIEG